MCMCTQRIVRADSMGNSNIITIPCLMQIFQLKLTFIDRFIATFAQHTFDSNRLVQRKKQLWNPILGKNFDIVTLSIL